MIYISQIEKNMKVMIDRDIDHLFFKVEPQHKKNNDVMKVIYWHQGLCCVWVWCEREGHEICVPADILKVYRSAMESGIHGGMGNYRLMAFGENPYKKLLVKHGATLQTILNVGEYIYVYYNVMEKDKIVYCEYITHREITSSASLKALEFELIEMRKRYGRKGVRV
jgi:hypothetical protein